MYAGTVLEYWYCAYLCLHSGVLEHLISYREKQEEKRAMRNQIVPRAWGGEHFCETVIFERVIQLRYSGSYDLDCGWGRLGRMEKVFLV